MKIEARCGRIRVAARTFRVRMKAGDHAPLAGPQVRPMSQAVGLAAPASGREGATLAQGARAERRIVGFDSKRGLAPRIDQAQRVGMLRLIEYAPRLAELDDAPGIHHRD